MDNAKLPASNIDPRYKPAFLKHLMEHNAVACHACDLAKELLKEGSSE